MADILLEKPAAVLADQVISAQPCNRSAGVKTVCGVA
jgi:hypothetical protein